MASSQPPTPKRRSTSTTPVISPTARTPAPSEAGLDLAAIAVRGRRLKHTLPGSPALPEREPPPDNRWQRGDVVDALYLADGEETTWAEWYRHLAERMIPPLAQMPRDLWSWEVAVEVADLSTAERLAAVGLSLPAPGRRSWPAFQAVGERLWREGWPGLLAPSAARAEGRVLCLFRGADGVGVTSHSVA